MDFVQLPSEVFSEIAEFLDVKDLLSCSLVNSCWRSAVNKNLLWKRHCQNHYNNLQDLTKYLETEQPLVSPWDITLDTNETLEPICDWRVRYIRKIKLVNNWKRGIFKKEYIQVKGDNAIHMETEGDLLALNLNVEKKFELWYIKDVPKLLGEVPYSLQHIMCLECFKLVNGLLIFVQCNLLQIFSVDLLLYKIKLKFRKLFNESENCSENIPCSVDITDWYMSNIGLYPSDSSYRCETVNNFFIGMVLEQDLKNTIFHIWDMSSGEKVKEENIPIVPNFTIIDIHFGTNTENIFLMLTCTSTLHDSSFSVIYAYNVKNTCYTNFLIKLAFNVPVILFTDSFIVWTNRTGDTISILNSKSGTFTRKIKEYDSMIKQSSVQVHGSLLIYATQFLLERVKVINLNTLQVLSCFQPNNSCTGLFEVLFVRPKFVFIMRIHDTAYDVEDTSKPLYTLKCKTICSNEIGTKLFAEEFVGKDNFLCILNFW